MSIGKRVRQVREHYRLTHYYFSSRLGEKENRIKSVEYEKQRVPGELLAKIVDEFQVNALWLLTGKGNMHLKSENILRNKSKDSIEEQDKRKARILGFIQYWIHEKPENDQIWLEGQLQRYIPEYTEYISRKI